nr:unnamed protein product [Spirometra erinaceieuropaei]
MAPLGRLLLPCQSPKELATRVISDLLEGRYDEEERPLKKNRIMELLDYRLSTYFTFNGQVYEQIQGTPMGSPIFGYLAEAVLQELEPRVFQSYMPKFWMRYVDDTFVILPRDMKETFKSKLNSIFPQIQFTMEEEKDGEIAFLDVQVSRQEDGVLQTGVFRKATDTTKILHYSSNPPLSHKRSCVRTLFLRINTHCSTEAENLRERKSLWRLFLSNGRARRRHQDWFDDNDAATTSNLLVEKIRLHKAHVNRFTDDNKAAFYRSRHFAQQRLYEMQDAWTARKAEEIQGYVGYNEWTNFFSATKAVYGPPTKDTAPLLCADGSSLLTQKSQIIQQWPDTSDTSSTGPPTSSTPPSPVCLKRRPTPTSTSRPLSTEPLGLCSHSLAVKRLNRTRYLLKSTSPVVPKS